jgi:SAM-dependent methyltransferase
VTEVDSLWACKRGSCTVLFGAIGAIVGTASEVLVPVLFWSKRLAITELIMSGYVNPEMRLAVSYYHLFAQPPAVDDVSTDGDLLRSTNNNSTQTTTSELSVNDGHNHIDINDEDTAQLWTVDHWTLEDEEYAEDLLQKSQKYCQIPSFARIEKDSVAWDRFYQQHQTRFFKDRHYLTIDFPHEFGNQSASHQEKRCWVEIGCGVGNAMLPLLQDPEEASRPWIIHGLDFSPTAIQWLQQDTRFQAASAQGRAFAYVCDISQPHAMPQACRGVATVATCFFCLSSLLPADHLTAVQNAVECLRPGGVLIVRDYGRYDAAQLKLAQQRHKQVTTHGYVKQDGTKVYYFSLDDLQSLMEVAGLQLRELDYRRRKCLNRSSQTVRRRVWVQGRFQKPLQR